MSENFPCICDVAERAIKSLRHKFAVWRERGITKINYVNALLWQHVYRTQVNFKYWVSKNSGLMIFSIIGLFASISFFLSPEIQNIMESHFTDKNFASFKTLLVTLGGALISADTIAFSFVMFAMQVNFERLPFGLFKKFSADKRFIGAFSGTFFIAIFVAGMSIIPNTSWIAIAALLGTWGIVGTIFLFVYCYHRALSLVNPAQQIGLLINDANKEMKLWGKRAKRATPLFKVSGNEPYAATHDLARAAYFARHPQWTEKARTAIKYAISFSRRYAERGDHEVSQIALLAILAINQAYVTIKGKTFFSNPPLIDNPLSTDGFLNDTLEHFRQNIQIGVARKDEQQIEQSLQVLTALAGVYYRIDYGESYLSKTHANLATFYLAEGVKAALPLAMPDVVKEGVRLLGKVAEQFLPVNNSADIGTILDNMGTIGGACTTVEKYHVVTLEAVQQLANLTFKLLQTESNDIRFVFKQLKSNISTIAKLLLMTPDTPFMSTHNMYLALYYSMTTFNGLIDWLTALTNAISGSEPENKKAKIIIRNLKNWSEDLYDAEKELFLMAVEKRSHFTFDLMRWIVHITKLLLAVSNSPACDSSYKEKLREQARLLISIFYAIPDEKDAILFIENHKLTELIFEAAQDAYQRDCIDVGENIQKLLLNWAFKAGKHKSSGSILEDSICGLAVLCLSEGTLLGPESLKKTIVEKLAQPNAPDQAIRDRAARNIREHISEGGREFTLSTIERALNDADATKLSPLLTDLANLLSPNAASEPPRSPFPPMARARSPRKSSDAK